MQKSPIGGSQTARGNLEDYNQAGSKTARGHLESNKALIDASNRMTTSRNESGLTSRQTGGVTSPKPMLTSRVPYNPPEK